MNFIDRVFTLYFDNESGTGTVEKEIDTSDERAAFENVEEVEKENESAEEGEEGQEEEGEELSADEDTEEPEEEAEEIQEGNEYLTSKLKKIDKDIFKKVPELRATIFREEKYAEQFPTVEEAADARESLEVFNQLQNDIMSGDTETLLEAVERTNKEQLPQFAANFLPALEKLNRDLYHNVLAPHFKKFLRLAAKNSDENIAISARNMNHWLFEDAGVEADAGLQPGKKSEKEDSLTQREKEFEQRKYNSFANDAVTTMKGQATRIIRNAFANSDMSPLIQKQLSEEIFARVDAELAKDKRHLGNMNNLWNQARREDFTTEGKNRIIRAYLSRAKVLIPAIRAKVLTEAKVSTKLKSEDELKRPTRIPSSGANSSPIRGKVDGKKIDWNKTDERALLDGKVAYKK